MAGCEVATYKEQLISQFEFQEAEKQALNITNQLGSFLKKLKQ